ncbi:5-dehydro-4-deoxyglucarate dehydratase [Terriglobus roseus DSM 18391]|uniref:Probable 5-dehydro-4-deoxyglucarate dehydratase n=1 Tax=Terriglobus roseus (strain DSM 18391 / NRRL B-41598 / KBS 63) TaxID=926566 RepID=I3ZME8_TERRK|nr:5-dehydro-4-deoxyglucarate dehydratase [Terriglobus roseus]AFL90416.1 5-dehydro-4-deoxyglucarate dehydratase [Terriglobus roseus DSM 18391]
MDPKTLASTIGSGLLSFPVTHFTPDGEFKEDSYRKHLAWLDAHKLAALFAAGGTGEYFSLTLPEYSRVVTAAVAETAGKMPILAGCGYGTRTAIEFAKAAETAGAQGILLFPPYLVNPDQDGLFRHVKAICDSTSLGVIVYNRDNAIATDTTIARMCDACPNLVGFKDGVGDLELMMKIYLRMGDRLTYIGGLPTAETFALSYLEMGVTTYSSAIFNFLPKWATDFYAAVRRRDHAYIAKEMREFVVPYLAIRDRRKGYAVSIVKAGVRLMGHDCGPVRTPLSDLTDEEMTQLKTLIGSRT